MKPNGKLCQILNNVESEVKNLNKGDYLIIIEGTNDVDDINYNPKVLIDEIENILKLYTHTNIIILKYVGYSMRRLGRHM